MKNVKILEYNGYATSEKGINYRAVAIGEDVGKEHFVHWRLCKIINDSRADFVNDTKYGTVYEALAEIDNL